MIDPEVVSRLTELERHQLCYRLRGLKYCDAKGNVIGVVNESLRHWNDCSMEMKEQVIGYTTRHSMLTALPTARVFGLILEHFHVLCPHSPSCLTDTEYKEMAEFAAKSGIEPPTPYKVCEICLDRV